MAVILNAQEFIFFIYNKFITIRKMEDFYL